MRGRTIGSSASSWDELWWQERGSPPSGRRVRPCSPRAAARRSRTTAGHHRGHRAAPAAWVGQAPAVVGARTSSSPVSTSPTPRATTPQAGFAKVTLLAGGPVGQPGRRGRLGPGPGLHLVARHHRGQDHQGRRPDHRSAAQYQKNPFCIMSLKSSPLANPQAMIGKKIGVQSTNTVGVGLVPQGQQHPAEPAHHGPGPVRPVRPGRPARSTAGSRSSPTSPSSCTTRATTR